MPKLDMSANARLPRSSSGLKKLVVRNTVLHLIDLNVKGQQSESSGSGTETTRELGPHHIPCISESETSAGPSVSDCQEDSNSSWSQPGSSTDHMRDSNRAGSDFEAESSSIGFPSVGSATHSQGTCWPCSFFRKGTCVRGEQCTHCHYQHDLLKRSNKKTRDRQKMRQKEEDVSAGASAGSPSAGKIYYSVI